MKTGESPRMHDLLIGLVFVAMVASPALIASMPKTQKSDEL